MRRLGAYKIDVVKFANVLALFIWLLGFSGNAFAQPQVAHEPDVHSCRYLDNVEGQSGYGKSANWLALAKYSVLNQAEKLAATHVVWVRFEPVGAFNGVAVAKLYKCN